MPLQRSIQFALLSVLALLLYCWWLAPSVVPGAPAAMLAICAVLARSAVRTLDSDAVLRRTSVACGVLGAVVFVPAILVEYLGRTVANGPIYGAVIALCALSAAVAAWRTARVRDAVASSVVTALIASLTFVLTVLGSFCLLHGTAMQDRFFRTEGDYDDFARSGMADFNTWIVGDLFGGVFFHLLFGLVLAAALGAAAGILVRGGLWLRTRYSPRPNTNSA